MKFSTHYFSILAAIFLFTSCNADPSSPGGKLGSKNYNGNYTMGATSGPATTYIVATGDTTIDMTYSLNGGTNMHLNGINFTDAGGSYDLYKTDAVGTLTGATTSDFVTLTWQYVTTGNTVGFTGTKVQ